MKLHPNARTTPNGRQLLVQRILEHGWTVARAAQAAGISKRTACKWLARYRAEGAAGLQDRSSRPHRSPHKTPAPLVSRIERLRQRRRTGVEIARELGVPASTVARILQNRGLGRLWRVDEQLAPPRRYEHPEPGALVHVDAKRLGRIGQVGHRIHGDYRRRSRGVGWETVFVCVDDHTRLAYAEVLRAEDAACATAFLRRALKRFEALGVRVQRVLTDNAKCYGSKAFTALCRERGVKQRFTRPYTPRTNGKAERFIQTLVRRWAYRRPYRTSSIRTAALRPWIKHYNHQRPHRSLGMIPPIQRLRAAR
jgi:transposase InsO family protein